MGDISLEKIKVTKNMYYVRRNYFYAENYLRRLIVSTEHIKLYKSNKKNLKRFKLKWIKGIPDFFYIVDDSFVFIECKHRHGLSYDQLKWAIKNDYKIRIIFLELIESKQKTKVLIEWEKYKIKSGDTNGKK